MITHKACILPYNGNTPKIHETAFIAPTATIIGNVTIEANASIWFGAVLRGDVLPIRIGANSNIQDGVIIHGDEGSVVNIAENVTVGHNAVIHGCSVEAGALIGMSATLLDDAHVGRNALVAAKALVTPRRQVEAGSMWAGSPAKQIKMLDDETQEMLSVGYKEYLHLSEKFKSICGSKD